MDDVNWKLASIIREILFLSNHVDWISFFHIPREWNGVGDVLEKRASEKGVGWDIVGKDRLPVDYIGILE